MDKNKPTNQDFAKAFELRLHEIENKKMLLRVYQYELESLQQKAEYTLQEQIRIEEVEKIILQNQGEIYTLLNVLKEFENEYYYASVYNRYILHQTDESIAEMLICDVSTIKRNRKKLIMKMALKLYQQEENDEMIKKYATY